MCTCSYVRHLLTNPLTRWLQYAKDMLNATHSHKYTIYTTSHNQPPEDVARLRSWRVPKLRPCSISSPERSAELSTVMLNIRTVNIHTSLSDLSISLACSRELPMCFTASYATSSSSARLSWHELTCNFCGDIRGQQSHSRCMSRRKIAQPLRLHSHLHQAIYCVMNWMTDRSSCTARLHYRSHHCVVIRSEFGSRLIWSSKRATNLR